MDVGLMGRRTLSFGGILRALTACGIFPLAACATLPDTPRVDQPARVEPVKFETARGPVSKGTSTAILKGLKSESGTRDILQKHLALEEAINRDSPLVLGNRLMLLQDGPATYEAMFTAIQKARDHINLETYIFEDGEIGSRFAALLLEKQAAGVQVNLIYDSVGNLTTPQEFFDRLRAGGIQLLEFNPVNPARIRKGEWLLNNRDHRKLLVTDGHTAFLGGINISESYSSGSLSSPGKRKKGTPPEAGWRDTHLQIEGPVVAEFQKYFLDTWARQNGPELASRKYFPPLDKRGDEIVRAIGSTAADDDSPIYLTLLSAIDHAERNIHITNAYFVPDPQLRKALAGAAQRGVDVQIVLPGRTDSWAVFHAGRSHYDELLDAGVKLYERGDTILHAKTASVDGVWSTVGSTNLDWRSFLHNDELNAIILGTDFARQMDAMFVRDRAAAKTVDPAEWKRRSPLLRIQEWLARRFEYWL
ncbi:MAG: phospholipase D-like domain-containing protein [Thiobacillus sp.]|nr:phospholipase D-like domain-containing protein [Thiobacillus sp.]